jgi:hypothetical protein
VQITGRQFSVATNELTRSFKTFEPANLNGKDSDLRRDLRQTHKTLLFPIRVLNLDHLHNRSRRSYDIENTAAWHESQITHPHKPDRLVVKDITADLSSRDFCLLIPSGIAPRHDCRPDFGERVPFGQRATRFLDQCGSGMAQRSTKIRHLIYAAMGTRGTAGRQIGNLSGKSWTAQPVAHCKLRATPASKPPSFQRLRGKRRTAAAGVELVQDFEKSLATVASNLQAIRMTRSRISGFLHRIIPHVRA